MWDWLLVPEDDEWNVAEMCGLLGWGRVVWRGNLKKGGKRRRTAGGAGRS